MVENAAPVLSETVEWEDQISRIDTDDRLVGGIDGNLNAAPRQLANRTQYLKQQLTALGGSFAELSGSGFGLLVLSAANADPIPDKTLVLLDYTGGMFDVTLPAEPTPGYWLKFVVVGGSPAEAEVHPSILANGNKILSEQQDFEVDLDSLNAEFIYSSQAAVGWCPALLLTA